MKDEGNSFILHPSCEGLATMNNLLTTNPYPLTTDSERHLAAELTGCPTDQLLKVRATADSLVVVIHTGQKFIYDLAAIQAAIERLAEGAGRFARDAFLAELDQDLPPVVAAPPPKRPRRAARAKDGAQ